MISFYTALIDAYPIVSIEDPLAEDDWDGWVAITEALDERIQIVGDDVFVTNPERLERGIEEDAANAILVKVNQQYVVPCGLGSVTYCSGLIPRA